MRSVFSTDEKRRDAGFDDDVDAESFADAASDGVAGDDAGPDGDEVVDATAAEAVNAASGDDDGYVGDDDD